MTRLSLTPRKKKQLSKVDIHFKNYIVYIGYDLHRYAEFDSFLFPSSSTKDSAGYASSSTDVLETYLSK
jgi:hypothetical protein